MGRHCSKHEVVCKICNKAFLAKSPRTTICYEEECQKAFQRENAKIKRKRACSSMVRAPGS